MYIAQAYKGLHDFWRYIIGVIMAIAGVFIFSVPHAIAIGVETVNGNIDASKMNDASYIMSLFEPNINLVFVLLPFVGGLIALFLAIKLIHKQSFKDVTTTRKKIDWSRVWFIFILWGVISSSFVLIHYYFMPEDFVVNFKLRPFLILCVIGIVLIPIQTSFEEYVFRGYLMQGIGIVAKNKWLPLILTSLVFGLLHIMNPEVEKLGYVIMVYYIGTGLMLGIMTLMDEGMELALGFHAANNLFTALLVTADWTAFQTHSIFKDISDPENISLLEIFVPVFVVFPILLFILSRKYKWSNWKDKLFGAVIEPLKENYKLIEDIGNDTES